MAAVNDDLSSDSVPGMRLSIVNKSPSRLSGPSFLHELVSQNASDQTSPALEFLAANGKRSKTSYRELHEAAGSLSERIIEAYPGPLDDQKQLVVPVLLPQCPALYIAQLAILKAGGAFCPLNLDAPPERVKFIVGDVSARVLITNSDFASKIPEEIGIILILVDQNQAIRVDKETSLQTAFRKPAPDDLAYIMYTSGSTGTPKGVGISHDAATQSLLAHDRHIPKFSRFLQFAAPTFDVSVFEIFFPLFKGRTLVCCDRSEMLNDLPAVLRKMEVDACELTPTVAGSLLRSRANAPGLRLLLTIGEMLTDPVIKEFGGDSGKPSILWAMYGPTEAAIHCTLQTEFSSSSIVGNIGVPLDTVSSFVVKPLEDGRAESSFEVLPVGEIGELAVGGHQLAVGYVNRPEQTAAAFIQTPYGRVYRTGDKARLLPDGRVECLGRISDGQVKLRGQRIELGEIEQAAFRTAGCHGAVAAVLQGILVLFCEVDDQEGMEAKIVQTCQSWLPSFMVPNDIVLMKDFPRLASGKVDRKELKARYSNARTTESEANHHPSDAIESRIIDLAQEVLGTTLNSNSILAASGMDSITAIRYVTLLRNSGFDVSAVDVLGSKSISGLRKVIDQRQGDAKAEKAAILPEPETDRPPTSIDEVLAAAPSLQSQAQEIKEILPCTPVQAAMLSETMASSTAYCNWNELEFGKPCTLESVVSWFHTLAEFNEALRTGFVLYNNKFVQIVWKALDEAQIRRVKRPENKFEICDQEGLLRPFDVQISVTPKGKIRTLLRLHHAIYDGWSFDLLLSDLNTLSQGDVLPKRPHFSAVSQYYQSNSYAQESNLARTFWAEQLQGFQIKPMPQLVAKATNDMVFSASRAIDISLADMVALSRKLECSTQVFFQAALIWLWGAILGSDDVVIGTVTSGRTIPIQDIENVVGPCLTTIPLRTKISQARTVRDLLEGIHATSRESLAHCTLPLMEIKKAAMVPSGKPLYDALFVYQDSIQSRNRADGVVRQLSHQDYLETKLLVEIEPSQKSYECRITYHLNVFHYAHIQILLGQLQSLLKYFVLNLDAEIASIPKCFTSNLTSQYNSKPKSLVGVPDVASLVQSAALAGPEKPAICFAKSISENQIDAETVSFAELNGRANRIARHLKRQGAKEDSVVAIIMEKSVMLYVGILAILKAGCAYLPLLPTTPLERIKTILTQADVDFCVVDSDTQKLLQKDISSRLLNIQKLVFKQYSDADLNIPSNPERVANVIYTSGSTGVPKGVCVTQLNITSNLDVLSRIYPVKEGSRLLQSCSQAFDVSVFEIFFAWSRGMCLCSAINDTLFEDLEHSIRMLEVTHLSMTPTVASMINPTNVPKVNFLVTSGEPMTEEVARKWVRQLYQGYGPSETTNICSVKKMAAGDVIRHLGYTFENTSAFILAQGGMDVMPVGCVGELCFGGDQVAAGYLKLPELTNQKFINHPQYGRLYRSGDMGRMLADGSLLIIGRVDDQVKLRGQRIELGEINSIISSMEDVKGCVTLLDGDNNKMQQLVTFYVPRSRADREFDILPVKGRVSRTNSSLYGLLKSKVPVYMVPSYLIPVSAIPTTSSGKVDKERLRAAFKNMGQQYLESSTAPLEEEDHNDDWTNDERILAQTIAQFLHIPEESIGRWTPFTSLGLDSVSSIPLAKQLQKSLNRRTPVSAILQNPCIARLVKVLPTQEQASPQVSKPADVFSSSFLKNVRGEFEGRGLVVQKILPCTPLQEAMLSSSTGGSSYLNKTLLRLYGASEKLKDAWKAMSQRHDILRTCFISTDDAQHPIAQVVLNSFDLPWLTMKSKDQKMSGLIAEHVKTLPASIDSFTPPVSLAIIQESTAEFMSFICHHALYDGVAVTRLFVEIECFVHGLSLSNPPPYEPFLQEILTLPESTDNFWRSYLSDLMSKELPCIANLSSHLESGLLCKTFDMSYSKLNEQLKGLNISLLSLAQASWGTLLSILVGSEDVCFGNVVSGRSIAFDRIDELVAPCFNTIPLRLTTSNYRRRLDVTRYFQKLNPELLQYQFTPLRRIQNLSVKNGGRLIDTLLLLQQPSRRLDDTIWSLERDDGVMDFPLVCELTPIPTDDQLEVRLHYERSSIDGNFALFIYDTLAFIFANYLDFPSSEVTSIESLPETLRTRLQSFDLIRPQEIPNPSSADVLDVKPFSDEEALIRGILSNLSKTPEKRINRHTTIYQLGLDSINAVQIAAMLRTKDFQATATNVIEYPTCAKLAAHLAKKKLQGSPIPLYDIGKFQEVISQTLESKIPPSSTVKTVLPCTPLQAGMLMEFLKSNGENYFNYVTLEMREDVSPPRLNEAWAQLVEHNVMLRTGFISVDHRDTSFAMVQYDYKLGNLPLLTVSQKYAANFDLNKWQNEVRGHALAELHQPPWSVVLIEGDHHTTVHLAIHHALYDAHSLHVLFRNFARLLEHIPMTHSPAPRQSVQEIMSQIQTGKAQKRSFWEALASRAVINNFPIMTPLRVDKAFIGNESRICEMSLTALQSAVKDSGFTIQALIQATWTRILSAYLGEPSVIFGVVFSGRNSEATQNTPLPCVTTLPIITNDHSENRKLLESMMDFNAQLHEHQHTPLTDIQRWLGHSNTRLFDTIVVYQKLDGDDEVSFPWRVVEDKATVDYPLSIEVEPQGDKINFQITFHDNVLPSEQAKLLLTQFDSVFCDLAKNPDGEDVQLIERQSSLFSINPAEHSELKSDVSFLHEFVEKTAERFPEKTALQFISAFDGDQPIGRNWTFRDLDINGNKVANILSPHVQPGGIVAICFDKCPEAHFAILGVLKAGCSFVALDSSAPPSRKEFIVKDSGASVLIINMDRSANLNFTVSIPVVGLDENNLAQANSNRPKLSRPLSPNDCSYCLYTSGTTGTPKGCEITHRNAVQAMLAFQKLFEQHWDYDSKWLQFASYHFDVSVLEQFWTWSVGITLVAAPRDLILEDLTGIISRLGITHIDLTPSLARLLHPDDVPSLCRGVFITGGEQLKQEILDVWGDKGVIHNFYGPTEATIGITTFPQVPKNGRASNIGRQFANVGTYVLRPDTDVPVLRGGVGELCVSGPLVGKGYLKRQDLTSERFPTLKRFNDRVYRTGDLVRILHDGCFDFLGRADDQVKLRGQRLEIGEINHCIRSEILEVTDVATVVVRNEIQQKDLLVSFIVTESSRNMKRGSSIAITRAFLSTLGRKVQDACRSKLPAYMVPTYILELPLIPLSSNNKAEIKELKRLFSELNAEELMQTSGSSNADLGEIGGKIVKVLAEMEGLDVGQFSTSTNIFEVGVDSISVLRFARALKREGLVKATPALLLKNPAVSDLIYALKTRQDRGVSSTLLESRQMLEACQHRHRGAICQELGVKPEEIEYIVPCSALQQGMISRSQTDDNEGLYFNIFRFELRKDIVLPRLQDAWQKVLDQNAILRTKFVGTGEGFIQVAMKEHQISWNKISMGQGDTMESVLTRRHKIWVEKNSQNIVAPIEFLLLKTASGINLVLQIFHALYDGNSFDLMLQSVTEQYVDGLTETKTPSFLDALLRGPLRNYNSSKLFWEAHLRGASAGLFPSLAEDPSSNDLSMSRVIPFETLETLRKSLGVTQQALVQALWATVLRVYLPSGVTFGIVVSGRSIELEGVDRTIGPLFNTVPYHHRFDESESWSSAIRKSHKFNTAILPFQHVPLRDIQKWCTKSKPLFDTLFSFQSQVSQTDSSGNPWTQVDSDLNADYPLAFEVTLLPNKKLQLLLVSQKGFADEKALNNLLDQFEAAAKTATKSPNGYISPQGYGSSNIEPQGHKRQPHHAKSIEETATAKDFTWTAQARTLQSEISLLADVDASTIGENTSLLELGLDSIDTIRLSTRLKRHGIYLTNSQLIKGQTIRNFISLLGEEKPEAPFNAPSTLADISTSLKSYIRDSGIKLDNVEDILPPTPLQDSMVSEMIHSDFQRYFNHDVLEISPEADIERFIHAWKTVILNSPIFRTIFVQVDSPAFDFGHSQVVLRKPKCHLQKVELDDPADMQKIMNEARERAREGAGKSDLLQLAFVKSGRKLFLVLSLAHALYDGWSLGLLHQDVQAAYTGSYSPRSLNTDYIGHIIHSTSTEASAFWAKYLAGAEPCHVLHDHNTSAARTVNRIEKTSSTSGTELKAFCKRFGISVQVVAQACWAAMLSSRCKTFDVNFGVVLSGREIESAEELLFPTMNTVPIRSILHGTVSVLLRYMQENMAGVNEFQHFPLRKIQRSLAIKGSGLFNTLFILQKSLHSPGSETKSPAMRSVGGSSEIEYPVCGEMEVVADSVLWRAACDSDYLTKEETNELIHQLDTVLCFFINSPDMDVLRSEPDGISVCGLPPFQSKASESQHTAEGLNDTEDNVNNSDWTQTEETLRLVLSDLSGIDANSIRKEHSVYHLGLDSISAIKASSLLRKKGTIIGVRDLLQAASIVEMARIATNGNNNSQQANYATSSLNEALPVTKIPALLQSAGIGETMVETVLPATAMQTHMLSVWQNSKGVVFFPEFIYELSGVRDPGSIESAWSALLASEPILRTSFVATTGEENFPFVQVVLKEFMSTHGLVSLEVSKTAEMVWTLKMKIHHALYDGVSLPSIIARFIQLLKEGSKSHQSGSESALFTRWKHYISTTVTEKAWRSQEQFWRTYLQGAKSTEFHIGQRRNSLTQARSNRLEHLQRGALPDVAGLRAITSKSGLSMQSLFFAAYAKMLASSFGNGSNREEVVFGIYLANRGAEDEDSRLPYPTLCLVPLRVKLPKDSTLLDIARQVQSDLHQISSPELASVGLWKVQAWTGVVLDSFVNFLALPNVEQELQCGSDVRLIEVTGASVTERRGQGHLDPRSMSWLSKNSVNDAYPDAVDVEVSVNSDGVMDIGVFGAEDKLGIDGCQKLITGIVDVLSEA